jgi:uncharacterized protein YdeI (YjbR/CyaY-like superfamily)
MPAVVVNPRAIRAFSGERAFELWLGKNHDRAKEIYVRIYKKHTGRRTVSPAQALDVALAWGWIDGIRKPFDERSFLQRFTPRRPKSLWSQRNREHVARLEAAGRMTPHGLKQVEAAKADGRWKAAYPPPSRTKVPLDLLKAIRREPRAYRTFRTLDRRNQFVLAFRTGNMKTAEGRAKKIASFVAMLKRGETPHPNGKRR